MCKSNLILLLSLVTLVAACSKNTGPNAANTVASNTEAVTVTTPPPWRQDIKPADIERIKWLEGTWKGTGEGQEPFYEQYRFEGTTMYEDSFEDSSLKNVKDSARYALINGEFRHTQNGRRVVASEITDDHIQFIAAAGDGNSYRFEKQPEGRWRVVLEWPATGDKPAKKVIYNMEPYKK